jgi:hypothetical protein
MPFTEIETGAVWYIQGTDDYPTGEPDALLNLQTRVPCFNNSGPTFTYHWSTMTDVPSCPGNDWLDVHVDMLLRWAAVPWTFGVVDQPGGVSRGALLLVAYYMKKNSWDRDTALAWLQGIMPEAQPFDPTYLDCLLDYEDFLGIGD